MGLLFTIPFDFKPFPKNAAQVEYVYLLWLLVDDVCQGFNAFRGDNYH